MTTPSRRLVPAIGGVVVALVLAACGTVPATGPGGAAAQTVGPMRRVTAQALASDGALECPATITDQQGMTVPEKPQGVDGNARLLPGRQPESLVVCSYPVLDMMQTIPTFVYLVPTLILFGLGLVPGLIATIIFAVPAPIRLTYLGISEVPKALVEAGDAFGCTRWQLLRKVKLPAALPTIMAGVNQCIMLSLSMVVIAALVGAGGLGKPVVRALNTVNIAQGFEAGLAIVLVAILLDRVCKQRGAHGG